VTETLPCRLCPRDDREVEVDPDEPLVSMYEHGVEVHGLPPDPEPWTNEMIEAAKHENA
jgi:hypothetical protein